MYFALILRNTAYNDIYGDICSDVFRFTYAHMNICARARASVCVLACVSMCVF